MQRENTINIGDAISRYIKECHMEDGLLRARIYDAWDELMVEIASGAMSREEALTLTSNKFYKDRVLSCRMTSSLVRIQLRFQIEQVRTSLNARLGSNLVDKIILS